MIFEKKKEIFATKTMINCLFSMKQKHKREKRTSAVKQQQQKSRKKNSTQNVEHQ